MGRPGRTTLVSGLAVAVVLGCGQAGAARDSSGEPQRATTATPKPATPPNEPVEIDSILWSAERRLRWSDFLARPQFNTIAAAMTSYVLQYEADCDSNVFSFRVVSAFLPEKSWVKGELLMRVGQSDRALQHEQTHFDLSEVHVRKIRRALVEMSDPCGLTEQARDAVVSAIINEDGAAQLRYDRETGHGSLESAQRQWDGDVARQLSALRRFGSNERLKR
jgi:Bacterial protein of unknown function (DUF922)